MDGLIIKQPFANDIIHGIKRIEYRAKKLPDSKKFIPVYLLSEGKALGKIKFNGHLYNKDSGQYEWEIYMVEPFKEPIPYIHPHGARVWIREVVLDD